MSISGSEGEDQIQAKIRELESSHSSSSSEVSILESKISDLMNIRERCYVQLATIYLPELDARSIEHTLMQVQDRVRGVFKEKQQERKSLEESMNLVLADKAQLEAQLRGVTESLNRKINERDVIQQVINDEFAKDQDYLRLTTEIEEKGKELASNKKRLEDFRVEAKRKLKPYQDERLFMYLVNKEFDSPRYRASAPIRMLDRVVARKVNFQENIDNYKFLLTMPDSMKTVLDERQAVYNALVEKAERIKKHIEDKHGLTEVLEAGEQLGAQREGVISKIARKDKEYDSYSNRRREVDNSKGEYHKSALDEIKKFLKGDSIIDLKRIAKETPDTRDDGLVRQIEEADSQMKVLRNKTESAKEKRDELSERVRGLQNILSKYRSNDYESSRSYFDSGLNLNALLLAYIAGNHSSDHVWNQISNAQHFKPKPQPSYSSSSSSYGGYSGGHSSSSSSSSFGGGGFSSRSSFGGGGFSTRGGF